MRWMTRQAIAGRPSETDQAWHTVGRGLHTSTSQLNLSRSWTLNPQQELTSQLNLKRLCHETLPNHSPQKCS